MALSPKLRNAKPNQGTLQRNGRAVPLYLRIPRRLGQALLGALLRFFRAGHVDLFGALCRFGKHADAVPKHLGKATDNRKVLRIRRLLRALIKLADAQFGDQRRVPRKNTQTAIRAGNADLRYRFFQELPLRRDDHELDGIG